MKNFFFADGLIEFDSCGNLCRIGDYASANIVPGVPFSFHADCDCTFRILRASGSGNRRRMIFGNGDGSVEITVVLEYDAECGMLSRRDSVKNLGGNSMILRRHLSRFVLNYGEFEVASQRSSWCRESEGAWNSLYAGRLELHSREGRWCEGTTPFAALRDRYSSHALGFMVFPEGDWTIRFDAMSQNGTLPLMTVEAGMTDERLEMEIAAGEEWIAPEILLQVMPNREAYSGSALMNRYLNRRFPLRPGHQPVIYNTWLDRMNALEVPRLERQLEAAKKVGCEVFVVDYGWYEDYSAFTRVDDWDECTDRAFYGKMKEFADKVRKAGLGFGFWVEFEFFSTKSKIVQQHPEWFFAAECHKDIVVPKSWLPEVEDMLVKSLAKTIRKYGAVFVKNDMNHSQGYEPSRLNRFQQGITRVMSRLKKMLPEVTFENCSSGGMRSASGAMLENFDMHFISDNASPLINLRMIANAAARFPIGRISHWYVASELHHADQCSMQPGNIVQPRVATWLQFQSEELHFGLISCITGIPGFSCDLASFSPENLALIAKYVEFYKKYRQQLLTAEMHLLTPPENFERQHGWLAMQLSARKEDIHFCYFFHHICDGDSRRFFHPEELEPKQNYRITRIFPEKKILHEKISGNDLMRLGMEADFQYDQQQGFRGKVFLIEKAE